MSKDTNFDLHSSRFKKNIYDTPKGQIRLEIVLKDMKENIPLLNNNQQISVLDAGCGMGQVSNALLTPMRQFTLCDLSQEMLQSARESIDTR